MTKSKEEVFRIFMAYSVGARMHLREGWLVRARGTGFGVQPCYLTSKKAIVDLTNTGNVYGLVN